MAIMDFFTKAKEAAKKAKNRKGNMGAGQKAYEEAADALEEEENKGQEVASAE